MNIQEAYTLVSTTADNAMNEIVKRQYFVLIFADKTGELHAYDSKAPANCLRSVLEKNTDFEFVHIIAETSEQSIRGLCTTLRQAREIRVRVRADMDRRTMAAAGAAAPSPSAMARPVL